MVWGLIESVPYPKTNESSTPERRLRGAAFYVHMFVIESLTYKSDCTKIKHIIRRSRQVSPENIIKGWDLG